MGNFPYAIVSQIRFYSWMRGFSSSHKPHKALRAAHKIVWLTQQSQNRWVYKPDNVVANPPLVVVIHSCQSTAQSYFQNSLIPWRQGSEKKGYITVWPSSPNSGTCWDVSSRRSLSHLGGGDSQAIANMILYAIKTYGVDPTRVYVTGGSSGAMMSNVLAATYPELVSAVSLYSGVAAGCFVSASGGVDQWNNSCSGGQTRASAEQWKKVALDMYPGYSGPRPKMQVWHGSVDTTLAPQNYQEEIKQWTAVFNVTQTPTSTVQNFPKQGYTTSNYGVSVQGIYAQGVGHSVPANLTASEIWFGL
ncbi:acetylxylan esterase A [Nemania serpens]|nr:acetylxylan esterase A [Nemania serpens]